jgi:hypothetical protein
MSVFSKTLTFYFFIFLIPYNMFITEDFLNPPKKYRPFVRWWWPGLAVTPNQIEQELELLDNSGFGGVEIQPFLIGGSGGASKEDCHRMMPNPYYYQILNHLLMEANKRELEVDLTLGSSWPPGSTSISKENNLKTLLTGLKLFKGGTEINEKIPEIQLNAYYKYKKIMKMIMGNVQDDFDKYRQSFQMIATIAVKASGRKTSKTLNFIFPKQYPLDFKTSIDITDYVDKYGIINWKVPGTSKEKWYLFSFYGGPTGMTPMSDSKSSPEKTSLVADIFDPNSVEILFKELIGIESESKEEIKSLFGNTLRAIFTDSQEIADEWFWTNSFFEYFKEKRGYDIKPYLPACFVPNRDNQFLEVFFQNEKPCFEYHEEDVGERLRFDWLMTLSDIWSENFIEYLSKRGSEYGIQHRIQTYGMPVDLLKTFGASDIPETETLFSGSIDFFKMASSAGILYKKSTVSSETFSWMRQDLTLTPLKWKVACDRLFISGINQNVYHGWTYDENHSKLNSDNTEKQNQNIYPGHYPWAGHGFSNNLTNRSPFWKYYKKLNTYVARVQYLMRGGIIQSNIAVYSQQWNYTYKHLTGDKMEEGYLEGYDSGAIGGPIPWFMRRIRSENDKKIDLQQKIGRQLTESGYWYTHINQECLENCNIEKDQFKIGFGTFKAIIFPNTEFISEKVSQNLKKFTENGISIIFLDKIPKKNSGFFNFKEKDKKIQDTLEKLMNDQRTSFFLPKYTKKNIHLGDFMKGEVGITPIIKFEKIETDIEFIWRDYEEEQIIFIRNKRDGKKEISLTLSQLNSSKSLINSKIYILNPWNGKITPFKEELRNNFQTLENNDLQILLQFSAYESKVLLFLEEGLDRGDLTNQVMGVGRFIGDKKVLKEMILPNSWNVIIDERDINSNPNTIEYRMNELEDWRFIKELKYFSGPGTYSKIFSLESDMEPYIDNPDDYKIYLDLGMVYHYAKLTINDKQFDTQLIPPYIFDISESLQKNNNQIEIEVGGTLQNRLIGYGMEDKKRWSKYRKRPLMPMGLLGPVKIIITKNKQ